MRYEEWPALENVLLEESWVLEVAASRRQIAFRIEAVLLPGHEGFEHPKPDQMYCYRTGWLSIVSENMSVELSGAPPAVDAIGQMDLGHIDLFEEVDGGWMLQGDWGTVRAATLRVELELY